MKCAMEDADRADAERLAQFVTGNCLVQSGWQGWRKSVELEVAEFWLTVDE